MNSLKRIINFPFDLLGKDHFNSYIKNMEKVKKLSDNDKLILESLSIIQEIKLDINNAVKINGGIREGNFQIGDQIYNYSIKEYPDGIYLPGDKEENKLDGSIFSIGFTNKLDKDNREDLISNLPKGGKENLIKIYSTMYKILYTFSQYKKPQNILITSYDKSGYFGIYSNLTKTNKLPNYNRKTIIKWNQDNEPVTSILLKKQ